MDNDMEKIKTEAAMAVKDLYGGNVLVADICDNGNVKVSTDKGDFLMPKVGEYTIKE